jgi:hypothetical protein
MSQRREALAKIEKEAGVSGLVVSPLSANLLRPSLPEEQGRIDRNMLYDFSGRSRKPQMALAMEFGLSEYPQPAGGCMLTDPIFSYRLQELLKHNPSPAIRDVRLLRLGRHFRYADGYKIIVGRDEKDNAALETLVEQRDYILRISSGHGSPLVLAECSISEEGLMLAARLCARYSSQRGQSLVAVKISGPDGNHIVEVSPADDAVIERYRIQPH